MPTRRWGMEHAERPGAPRAWVWALVPAVLLSWCLAGLAAWAGVAPSAGPTEATTAPGPQGDRPDADRFVVLVGVPGLTWDLVDEERTPALAGLAREGGAGALVLRGEREVTCTEDAWLTLGAGQRAGTDLDGCAPEAGRGESLTDLVDGRGVADQAWHAWQ